MAAIQFPDFIVGLPAWLPGSDARGLVVGIATALVTRGSLDLWS